MVDGFFVNYFIEFGYEGMYCRCIFIDCCINLVCYIVFVDIKCLIYIIIERNYVYLYVVGINGKWFDYIFYKLG